MKNAKLAAKLQPLLPAGTDVHQAAAGFKNQGQFVAAVHVSNNLGIPFDRLKAKMVEDSMSLGQAIQELKPSADATAEVRRAQSQSSADVASTTGTGATATGTSTTPTTGSLTSSGSPASGRTSGAAGASAAKSKKKTKTSRGN